MMNGIRAIQTFYKGYHFRSRLEARWAVFFDALGMEWGYETEGFELSNGDRYLPDFWLPGFKTWVEIKGEVDIGPFSILETLASDSGQVVAMFVGSPWDAKVMIFEPMLETNPVWCHNGYLISMNDRMMLLGDSKHWRNRDRYPDEIIILDDEGVVPFDFAGCDTDEAKSITGRIYDSDVDSEQGYAKFDSAISKSKRARFEFGEAPQ